MKVKTKTLCMIGLMTAVICVISPFSIPIVISPVPITLGFFAIYLTLFVLGMMKGTVSVLTYLLIGLVGLPVFSGFSGGIGKVLGPTGGYMIGYIFLALIGGFFIEHWGGKWYLSLLGMILGTATCYLFGTLWISFQLNLTFAEAFAMAVLPYLIADLIKMLLALFIGTPLRRALKKSNLI